MGRQKSLNIIFKRERDVCADQIELFLSIFHAFTKLDSNTSATVTLRSRLAGFEGRSVGVVFSETGQRLDYGDIMSRAAAP